MPPGTHSTAQLGVQRLDGVRGVDDPANLLGEPLELDYLSPGPSPTLGDGGVFPPPIAVLEGLQRGLTGVSIDRPVDLLQPSGDELAILPGDEVEAVAQQMDDAHLHQPIGEDRRDRFWKALEPVERWVAKPYWQHFGGVKLFHHELLAVEQILG